MRPLNFTSKCQDVDIREQYEKYKVRCFDLRVMFKDGCITVVHNLMEYKITEMKLLDDLQWLDDHRDAAVRVLLDVRFKKNYTSSQRGQFVDFCYDLERSYKHIKFWCGRSLYNWEVLYEFAYKPSCEEDYSSVSSPKLLDDWCPRLYAKLNNKKIKEKGTDKDYLMIDFVNY